jgi:uncharacterized protein
MKNFVIFFLLLISLRTIAQEQIVVGRKDTLFSKIFNDKREIWVSLPTDYNSNPSTHEYPVVYLLDGPNYFLNTIGLITATDMIVVGIVGKDRFKEFFPSFSNDTYAQFLKDELIPYIDKKYPTKPYRVLIGHSLAGLRVIHTAIYNPDLFNSYLAIEPSLGDQRNKWYKQAQNDIKHLDLKNKKIFIAMAQTMHKGRVQDTASIKKDTTSDSNHMRVMMEFSEIMMKKNNPDKASYSWKFYPNDSHNSVVIPAIYDGLNFIFNFYGSISWDDLFNINTSPTEAVKIFKDYYENISDGLGYKVIPPENSFLIDYIIMKKQYDKAQAFALYNLECYPDNQTAKDMIKKIKDITKKQ